MIQNLYELSKVFSVCNELLTALGHILQPREAVIYVKAPCSLEEAKMDLYCPRQSLFKSLHKSACDAAIDRIFRATSSCYQPGTYSLQNTLGLFLSSTSQATTLAHLPATTASDCVPLRSLPTTSSVSRNVNLMCLSLARNLPWLPTGPGIKLKPLTVLPR